MKKKKNKKKCYGGPIFDDEYSYYFVGIKVSKKKKIKKIKIN